MTLLPDVKKDKALTAQQEKFLDALFGEANGNPKHAGEIAEYAEGSYTYVIKSLKSEIIKRAETVLAAHSPKAVMGLVSGLDADGSLPQANIRIEAAKQILDRVGLGKREQLDINAKVAHGIFILPPKDDIINGTTKSVSDKEA
jgi:hypothetical protein